MKIKDCAIVDPFFVDWYVPFLPVAINVVGYKWLDGDTDTETDRQIITAINSDGRRRFIYHDSDGFKQIRIKVEPIG